MKSTPTCCNSSGAASKRLPSPPLGFMGHPLPTLGAPPSRRALCGEKVGSNLPIPKWFFASAGFRPPHPPRDENPSSHLCRKNSGEGGAPGSWNPRSTNTYQPYTLHSKTPRRQKVTESDCPRTRPRDGNSGVHCTARATIIDQFFPCGGGYDYGEQPRCAFMVPLCRASARNPGSLRSQPAHPEDHRD
jgi:hypothetical protein